MDDHKYQVMPDMGEDEYNELKADIAERGVLVPVEVDEDGNVLDGHHRVRACEELGITDYPTITREGMTEQDKLLHAFTLNTARRHLTREQKAQAVKDLLKRDPTLSDRKIAKAVGVSHPTVGKYRKQLESGGGVVKVTTSEEETEGLTTFTCCICGTEQTTYRKKIDGRLVNTWAYDPWPMQTDGDCCFECWEKVHEVVERMPEEARYRHWLGPHWRDVMDVAQDMIADGRAHLGDSDYDPVREEAEFERRLQERGIHDIWH